MLRVFQAVGLAIVFSALGHEAEAPDAEVVDHVVTARGDLEIVKDDTSHFRDNHFRILLAGQLLAKEETESVGIANPEADMDPGSQKKFLFPKVEPVLILLQIDSGGSGCPSQFRLVDVEAAGTARITDTFGTCANLLTISREGDILRIELPYLAPNGSNQPRPGKQIWMYDAKKHGMTTSCVPKGKCTLFQ